MEFSFFFLMTWKHRGPHRQRTVSLTLIFLFNGTLLPSHRFLNFQISTILKKW